MTSSRTRPGESRENFAEIERFGDAIQRKGKQFAPRAIKAFEKAAGDLKLFYGKGGVTTLQQARVGGMKLCLPEAVASRVLT